MGLARNRPDGTRRGGPVVTLREGSATVDPRQLSWLPEPLQRLVRARTFSVADMREARRRAVASLRLDREQAGQLQLLPACHVCRVATLAPVETRAGFDVCVICHTSLELGTIALHGWVDAGGPTGRHGEWCSCLESRCTYLSDWCCYRCRVGGITIWPALEKNPDWAP